MDQQPKIPTLKDTQKPQLKIKGLGVGLTLFDRLKQFKKKDLAFILAGLGTLFMAPLAEHFMMSPENGDGQLQQGWGKGGGAGSNLFGGGSSPYENGNNTIAQGGAIGGGGDIITPLNVRDPSALVMGPGAAQQPPAGSGAPSVPPPTAPRNEADYKDALAGAASRGASAAMRNSSLPVPKVALGGSGLRGLGAAGGGGSSASGSLAPLNSGNLGQAGTGGGGLNLVRSSPNFRGAAGARGPNSPSNLDGTRKAGANAGDAFNRAGNAMAGLNAAANEQIPAGSSGFGGGGNGGAGANDKSAGGTGPGGSKSIGESLAFIAAKERMMENLKLEFEKRRLKDPELLLYGIRNDSLKAMASELTKNFTQTLINFLNPNYDPNAMLSCADGGYDGLLSGAPKCGGNGVDKNGNPLTSNEACVYKATNGAWKQKPDNNTGKDRECTLYNGNGKSTGDGKNTDHAASGAGDPVVSGQPSGAMQEAGKTLTEFCAALNESIDQFGKDKGNDTGKTSEEKLAAANAMKSQLAKMVSARDALYGKQATSDCQATRIRTEMSVQEFHDTAVSKLKDAKAVPGLLLLVDKPQREIKDARELILESRTAYGKALDLRQQAVASLEGADMKVFDTGAFGTIKGDKLDKLLVGAKSAKVDLSAYAASEEKLLKEKIEPLIAGAEFSAGNNGTPTIPAVMGVNQKYEEAQIAVRATKLGVNLQEGAKSKDAAGATATAATVPSTVGDAEKAAGEVKTKTGDADAALSKIPEVLVEMEKQKRIADDNKAPYVPEETQKKAVTDAYTAVMVMRQTQMEALNGVQHGLNALTAKGDAAGK